MSKMMINLVLLAYGAPRNECIDKRGEARPPEVPF